MNSPNERLNAPNDGQFVNQSRLIPLPQRAADQVATDSHWAELLALLERLFRFEAFANGLSPDDAEDLRSNVLVRLLSLLLDDRFRIRTTFESWLLSLIRNEIRSFLRHAGQVPQTFSIDHRQLAQFPADRNHPVHPPSDANHLDHPKASTRRNQIRPLLQAIESVRSRVSESSWAVFLDVVVNESDIKSVAYRHGKSYSAVQKTCKRIGRMLREESAERTPDNPNPL